MSSGIGVPYTSFGGYLRVLTSVMDLSDTKKKGRYVCMYEHYFKLNI